MILKIIKTIGYIIAIIFIALAIRQFISISI